jgi:geranylgeranyl diphosphate synthase type II
MSIESYRMIAKAPASALPAVLALFSTTAAQVCEGQQYDMDFEDLPQVPMADYLKMIGLKTAVLIACSAKMGALIAGASAEDADLLYKFGYDLGLAFQIADDWLDTYGDPAVFGKAIGGDIVNNKKSWLLTRALEKAGSERFADALAMPVSTDAEKEAKITAVKKLYEELSIEQEAKEEIRRFHYQAMGYVEKLNLGKIKSEMLHRYADMLLGRRK